VCCLKARDKDLILVDIEGHQLKKYSSVERVEVCL